MTYLHPPEIPNVSPYITQPIMLGLSRERPKFYNVCLTEKTMKVEGPDVYPMVLTRHEAMDIFIHTLHAASVGTAAGHNPFMFWFVPGEDFRGDDAQAYRILNGFARCFLDYHTVRRRAYTHILGQLEPYNEDAENDEGIERSIRVDWESCIDRLEDLVRHEQNYCAALKSLVHNDRLYGKTDSMVASFQALPDERPLILTSYH